MDLETTQGAGTGAPQVGSETPTVAAPGTPTPQTQVTTTPPPTQPRGLEIPRETAIRVLQQNVGWTPEQCEAALSDPHFVSQIAPALFAKGVVTQVTERRQKDQSTQAERAKEFNNASAARKKQLMAEARTMFEDPDDRLAYVLMKVEEEATERGATLGKELAKQEFYGDLEQRGQMQQKIDRQMEALFKETPDLKDKRVVEAFTKFLGRPKAKYDSPKEAWEDFEDTGGIERAKSVVNFRSKSGGLGGADYEDVGGSGEFPQGKSEVLDRAKEASKKIRAMKPTERTPEAVRAAYANVW